MKCIACNQLLEHGEKKILAALYSLTPREYKIIIMRFLFNMRLEECGSKWSATRERIKQIENKAFRKLSFRAKKMGISLTPESLKEYLESVKHELQGVGKVEKYALLDDFEYKQSYYAAYLDDLLPPKNKLSPVDVLGVKDIPLTRLLEKIDFLDLPVRYENCLRSAGIYTILDLVNCSHEDLISIKNLGAKALCQIKEALHLNGLELNVKLSDKNIEEIKKLIVQNSVDIGDKIEQLMDCENDFLNEKP